jgi:ribose transport system substrate-binding protein
MWQRAICLVAIASIVGCSGSANESAAKPSKSDTSTSGTSGASAKKRIAVIPKGATHEFWKSVHAGAERASKELGNVEILWKAPSRDDNRDDQVNLVQNFVTMGVDGICLAPIDAESLVNVVKETKGAGIPTVIFDSGLADPSLAVSYVATDNEHGGQLAAEEMVKRLGNKGNVILLRYSPGSQSTAMREKGFLDGIAKFPDIHVLSSNQYAGTSEQTAMNTSQTLLLQFGKQVNGIFAVNETSAAGMKQALDDARQAGQVGEVVFIGFDSSNRIVEALRDGKIQAVVLQDPVNMGYEAVKAMAAHLEGKPVEARIPTGEAIATKENMDEERIHRLLNPEQF